MLQYIIIIYITYVIYIGVCQCICGLLDMKFTKIIHFSYAAVANLMYGVNFQLTEPSVPGAYIRGYKRIVANLRYKDSPIMLMHGLLKFKSMFYFVKLSF